MLKEWLRAALGYGGRDDAIERKLEPYLRDENACAVLRLVLENPAITADTLAGRMHGDRGLVAGYLDRLGGDGLITAEGDGAGTGYHITGEAKAAVAEHLPLNYQCPGMMRE